jgi:dimethylargininase
VPKTVVAREVSASYSCCIRSRAEPIDLERARAQHAAYVAALRALEISTEVLPALDDLPDAVFMEDVGVVLDRSAVIARPGAAARRAETAAAAEALAAHRPILHAMREPATLDGGDVLRAGELLFAGRSARTNEAGIAFLAEAAMQDGLETVEVPVAGGLHLKSACTPIEKRAIVYYAPWLDPQPFEARGFRCVEVPEPEGANVLALGATILVSGAAPRTAAILEGFGFRIISLDLSEIHKGEGALTCLSLRL